ncbi:hypothetical protein ACQP25_16905 [Microtetraspora malaysiensis]|uniref:hypothetical protein n=1 Tax=Microtetraspora malaysiensis TaxID=161358 RepID=UPI003D941BD2
MAAITLVFVAGATVFTGLLVHVIVSREVEGLDIAVMVAASLGVAASVLAAARRRPAIGPASIAEVYEAGYGVEH